MSKKKEYTLTGKSTVTGLGYSFSRGEVVGEAEYEALTAKHKGYFEEGRKDLTEKKPNPAAVAEKKEITELVARVEALEKEVAGIKLDAEVKAAEQKQKTGK